MTKYTETPYDKMRSGQYYIQQVFALVSDIRFYVAEKDYAVNKGMFDHGVIMRDHEKAARKELSELLGISVN